MRQFLNRILNEQQNSEISIFRLINLLKNKLLNLQKISPDTYSKSALSVKNMSTYSSISMRENWSILFVITLIKRIPPLKACSMPFNQNFEIFTSMRSGIQPLNINEHKPKAFNSRIFSITFLSLILFLKLCKVADLQMISWTL